ncbi:hypothetical protein AB9J70_00380 [Elizabethkingia anophelis]|uniref:hypothetical protein n=1 Tax=Elizabethkingia anophelis TaxID=1117645 RepID=UPI003558F683
MVIDGVSESLIGSGQTVTTDFAATPAPGKNTNLNVNLYKIGGTIGGVTWATGNLYYDYGSGQQKIRPSDITRWRGAAYADTDYWKGLALTPNGTHGQGDPCTKVFPENTWRLPTQADFQILVNRENDPQTQYDGNGINNSVSFAADNGKRVNFNPDGQRGASMSNIPSIGENVYGQYWTSNQASGNRYVNFQSGGSSSDVMVNSNGPYSIELNKLNIRCVRNK